MNWNPSNGRNVTSNQPLTLEQVAQYAPSALATHAHESCTQRYTHIPTVDVISNMMRNGFEPFKAAQSVARVENKRTYTKHLIRFRHQNVALHVGDSIPEIVLVNSHDGTSAYKLIAGIFKVVCCNGLIVSESTISSISIRHSGDILANVVEGSYRIVENSKKAMDAVRDWSQLQLTSGEQQAFARSAHIIRFGDREDDVTTPTPVKPEQLLEPRRYADNGNDLWSTFNRVQENAVKGGLQARIPPRYDAAGNYRPGRRTRTREVKGIDQDVRLNRALWQLAERMAELKHAG